MWVSLIGVPECQEHLTFPRLEPGSLVNAVTPKIESTARQKNVVSRHWGAVKNSCLQKVAAEATIGPEQRGSLLHNRATCQEKNGGLGVNNANVVDAAIACLSRNRVNIGATAGCECRCLTTAAQNPTIKPPSSGWIVSTFQTPFIGGRSVRRNGEEVRP
jgi:hypothetical protein